MTYVFCEFVSAGVVISSDNFEQSLGFGMYKLEIVMQEIPSVAKV